MKNNAKRRYSGKFNNNTYRLILSSASFRILNVNRSIKRGKLVNIKLPRSLCCRKKASWYDAVFYPESLPPDWVERLSDVKKLTFVISPLHDKDINSLGTLKKPHYHLMFYFKGGATPLTVFNIVRELNQSRLEFTAEPEAMFDYLVHANHPTKAQYERSELRFFNGFSNLSVAKISSSDLMFFHIFDYIDEHDISSFHDLIIKARIDNRLDILKFSVSKTYMLNLYLREHAAAKKMLSRKLSCDVLELRADVSDTIEDIKKAHEKLDRVIEATKRFNDNLYALDIADANDDKWFSSLSDSDQLEF